MKTLHLYRHQSGAHLFDLNQAGKLLFNMGHHHFMRILRNNGWLLNNNTPSQPMLAKGYMVYDRVDLQRKNTKLSVPVTLVTVEGLSYLKRAILKRHRQALKNNPVF